MNLGPGQSGVKVLKGQATFIFTDKNTGKVTQVREETNFVFNNHHMSLWSGDSISRIIIDNPGTLRYPTYSREMTYFSPSGNFITGYAPTGTQLKRFFQKTDDSPAYYEYYSVFLPPAETRAISAIALISGSMWDNATIGYTSSPDRRPALRTGMNLNPPCFQSSTEFLNVYYRLIMLDDEDDDVADFIKNEMILDIDRGTQNALFPSDVHKVYPFRITEPVSNIGNLNFLSLFQTSTTNRETIIPASLNNSLQYARKTWAYPPAAPNQYTQIQGAFIKSTLRGGANLIENSLMLIRPEAIVPAIGEGISGVGNVFATSSSSDSDFFDPAFFPIGSGKMFASGTWDPEPLPKKIVCEIQQTGQYAADATYRVFKYHTPGHIITALPMFPAVEGSSYSFTFAEMKQKFDLMKNRMYKDPSKVHYSQYMRTWIRDRAFITWDSTGITIYDVYMGKLTSFDSSTTPQLNVSSIRDVKVAPNGDIYIACANFGLYRLRITEHTTTLTHIGQFPGSQQKCYAIDIDNTGNVYGVFWGQGLYYSIDSGETWVNAAINYSAFSGYDESGTNSKWRFCTRVVCNPNRNAADGVAQLLLLSGTNSPDDATTAGCWWDQQTTTTTGITNSAMRASLSTVRTAGPKENFAISSLQNKWFFANAGTGGTAGMVWVPFLHNAAVNSVSGDSRSLFSWNCLHMETVFDYDSGTFKEYIYNGPWRLYSSSERGPCVVDVATNAVQKQLASTESGNHWSSLNSAESNCIYFGKNSRVCFELAISSNGTGDQIIRARFTLRRLFPLTKEWRQWTSESFGWDGGNWVKWHLGNKPCNETEQPFERGVMVRFANGPMSTESFHVGDQYTFTLYDGLYKDNATKLDLKDTIYFKPKNDITTFDPPSVQLVDRSSQVGILNSADINIDWNIDKLPDTVYDGEPLVLNGDHLWGNVSFMGYLGSDGGANRRLNDTPTVLGAPVESDAFSLFGETMTYFNGESGYAYPANSSYNPGSNPFTFEGFFVFETVGGVEQILMDARNSVGQQAAIAITQNGRVGFWNGTSYLGDTGPTLSPGVLYHIQVSRNGNTIECAVNGTVMWTAPFSSGFSGTNAFRLMARFGAVSGSLNGFRGWAGCVRFTVGFSRYNGNFTPPTSRYPTSANVYSGARLKLSGNFNEGGIFSRRELVGNWTVVFRDIDNEMRRYEQGRPILSFGISTTNRITTMTDIGYRIIQRSNGLGYERWLNPHSTSTSGALSSTEPYTIASNVTMIRFRKLSNIIYVDQTVNNGVTWSTFRQFEDLAPVHYICMYQVQPWANFRTPSVEIISNGSDYFSKVGDPVSATGVFNPKFLAIDCYWEHDLNVSLDGTPVTKIRSNYQDQMLPLEGECYAHQHGTIRFHPNDAGKTITGKVIAIRD